MKTYYWLSMIITLMVMVVFVFSPKGQLGIVQACTKTDTNTSLSTNNKNALQKILPTEVITAGKVQTYPLGSWPTEVKTADAPTNQTYAVNRLLDVYPNVDQINCDKHACQIIISKNKE